MVSPTGRSGVQLVGLMVVRGSLLLPVDLEPIIKLVGLMGVRGSLLPVDLECRFDCSFMR